MTRPRKVLIEVARRLHKPRVEIKPRVTLSAGVAERAPGEPRDDTIARADKAHYEAKHAERNRVMVD